jgi:hypothetical protein
MLCRLKHQHFVQQLESKNTEKLRFEESLRTFNVSINFSLPEVATLGTITGLAHDSGYYCCLVTTISRRFSVYFLLPHSRTCLWQATCSDPSLSPQKFSPLRSPLPQPKGASRRHPRCASLCFSRLYFLASLRHWSRPRSPIWSVSCLVAAHHGSALANTEEHRFSVRSPRHHNTGTALGAPQEYAQRLRRHFLCV